MCVDNYAEQSRCVEVLRNRIAELERENAEVRSALDGIMPFVEEDYIPEYATQGFKAAVEKARAALGRKEV